MRDGSGPTAGDATEVVLIDALSDPAVRSPGAAAAVLTELITSGDLPVGTRLPTIRSLSQKTGLSTRTVVGVWAELRGSGLVETNRRGGTVVLGARPQAYPADRKATAPDRLEDRDLLTGSPDYELQPDLTAALIAGLATDELHHPGRDYITDRLRSAVVAGWPFDAKAFVAAGGGSEGLLLAVEAAAPAGSLIAVEEPIIPGFLDTLTEVGYRVVGIASDERGASPDALAEVVRDGPAAVVLQPEGAYSDLGALTDDRAAELAEVLDAAPTSPWIVEDDAVGPLATSQAPSLGRWFPDRSVRVRSYCKAYGMDIKTCVIGGSAQLVDRAIHIRVHGIAANSRILQNGLAHLVADDAANDVVEVARERYAARRRSLVAALRERAVPAAAGPNSLVVWADVQDETGALVALAQRGILVGAGSRSFPGAGRQPRLRIAVPQLPDDPVTLAALADAIAAEATGVHREFLE
ncbi:hypothetical protein GCM10009624_03290 [Gordonia sinesedis]